MNLEKNHQINLHIRELNYAQAELPIDRLNIENVQQPANKVPDMAEVNLRAVKQSKSKNHQKRT